MKNSSMPDFPMALPFSIAQYFPLSTTVQCSMGTNFPKPQLGNPKWCQALYEGHCTLCTVCRLVTLVTNWGSVAADSAVDFSSHIRRARKRVLLLSFLWVLSPKSTNPRAGEPGGLLSYRIAMRSGLPHTRSETLSPPTTTTCSFSALA